MKSIDNLTCSERLYSSIKFFTDRDSDLINFAKELKEDYNEDQLDEINRLVTDMASQAVVRLVQFITDAKTDKQIVMRVICLKKLFENRHGNWLDITSGHDVTVKSVRSQRDKINEETGMYIQ